jgi:2'-5' RNA ligase
MAHVHTKRCFIAFPLDEVMRADLADAMANYDLPGLRKLPPDNLHVTVKFLGNVTDEEIGNIVDVLDTVAQIAPPFDMDVAGSLVLPNPRRARVLAAMLDAGEEPGELFGLVEDAMSDRGFRREGRAYRPHITLGRFRNPPREIPPLELPQINFPVDRLALYQSELSREGARYILLADWQLTGP